MPMKKEKSTKTSTKDSSKEKKMTLEEVADQIALEMCANLKWNVSKEHIENVVELGIDKIDDNFIKALDAREKKFPNGKFLKITPMAKNAINKIAILHNGQTRKGNKEKVEFTSHLLSVGEILSKYTDNEEVISAGMLHDALEDGKENSENYSPEKLKAEFNERVAYIVFGATEDLELKHKHSEKGSWKQRKEKYIQKRSEVSAEANMVCCADKIHNLMSLHKSYLECGEDVWNNFNSSKENILWFYESVLEELKKNLNHPIVNELAHTFADFKKILK